MHEPPTSEISPVEIAVRARQQWLFSPARPLVERFGHEFFRAIPKSPGIYIMRGQGGRPRRPRVLYVGKAKNLRERLGSYRHVHPNRDSRKTVRLVHAVESIAWEVCGDETAALLRENELLREHRPLFNRMNIRPEAHGCIGIRCERGLLEFHLGEPTDERWRWYGSFKGGRKFALAAMLRLLVQVERRTRDWSNLPGPLLTDRAPERYSVITPLASEVGDLLHGYLTGRTWSFVDHLAGELARLPLPNPFLATWRMTDLEALRTFYMNGPRRNRRWREQLGLSDEDILRPEDLDDLPVKVKLTPEASPWAETIAPIAVFAANESPFGR